MEREEFKILVKAMKAVYAQPTFIPDKDAFDVWYGLLQDLPYEQANLAIQKYGICYICGKNPTMKGKKVCDKCYETRLSTLPAMWENANNDYFRQLNYARFCMIKNQRKEKTSGSDFNV